ncbi:hypothetical protein [Pseudomonas veronii]|uniref:CHAD domain-containing protein n=3 Tax=Pseudomonas veronii TaxID=76761 RepID=A0ABS0VMK4_PSEVE|nr:hypothetical protein [Pseudomonas veronii]MBI6552625.1 hypothetical protein [Pseudomonas veronii]MBI6652720.1 hypothetical protein [Pseudomonas veronii]
MPSSNFSLESPPATKAQLAALMQNILDDDVVNLQAPCPTGPAPDLTAMELADCYRLAWQLLVTGVDIPATRRLVAAIAGKGSATAEQTVQFKFMRARFKKMRFACANYSEQHAYPESLDSITRLMGRFQDAFKNGQRYRTLWLGIRLWCRLRDGFFAGLHDTLIEAKLSTVESFQRYIAVENQHLAETSREDAFLTARQFHDLRKIISRRIALSDTRRALSSSPEYDALSLFLATINGLMGKMHDDLVVKKIQNKLVYEQELFKFPDEISTRIRALVM